MLILSETLFNGLDHVATVSKEIQDINAIAGIKGLAPQEVYV